MRIKFCFSSIGLDSRESVPTDFSVWKKLPQRRAKADETPGFHSIGPKICDHIGIHLARETHNALPRTCNNAAMNNVFNKKFARRIPGA